MNMYYLDIVVSMQYMSIILLHVVNLKHRW